ncbi:arylsulfatase B [Desulfosarcina ovata]|uniref:N-acetylgalactosamine-6-sulfatase n=1 Tax=Desulfosarcina ovata subsp. ovata TaxID=2752305 RepID=A0A5K8AE06_9BACT|nr:arylsulfatase [Desulfosarcina ovata]BBO90728.1 N-acetylgalactosamine-6-sulfatase [Desulfosarcina ovata subsp. ovata]
MKIQKVFRVAICIPVILLAAATVGAAVSSTKKPNIVIIVADDLGYSDVGFNNAKDMKTPNLDTLASQGMHFKSLYSQPFCTPTRAALMTGRYPMRYGLQTFVITPGQKYGLNTEETTLADALKAAGYHTYAVGKWHLGHADEKYWPQNRGFDYFYGCSLGEVDFYTKERVGVIDWQRNGEHLKEDGYFTTLITEDAVRLIDEQPADKPFFLYMAHLAVHAPYQAPQKYIDRFAHIKDETRRIYAAMAAAMDDSVAEVLKALEKKGVRDNTIVLFLADNGGIAEYDPAMAKGKGEKPAPATNTPFRGSKGGLYEGGVRSASFINWPKHIHPGTTEGIFHVVDIMPTLVKLAGGKMPADKTIDGKDIWPAIAEGKPSPRNEVLLNAEFHRGAVRKGNWKLIKNAALPSSVELYNLAEDIGESHNLAEQYPDKVKALEKLLNNYAKQSKGSLFLQSYMPFIQDDFKSIEHVFEGNEDAGEPGEKPALPSRN